MVKATRMPLGFLAKVYVKVGDNLRQGKPDKKGPFSPDGIDLSSGWVIAIIFLLTGKTRKNEPGLRKQGTSCEASDLGAYQPIA